MQVHKALLLEVVGDNQDVCWVMPSQLMKTTQAEEQIFEAVSCMLLQHVRYMNFYSC